jgi:hypothetical protein
LTLDTAALADAGGALCTRGVGVRVPDLDLPDGGSEEDTSMRLFFHARPAPTEESHRVTPFEIFFDLVFVFALIQVTAFMAKPPTLLLLVQGLVVVLLLVLLLGLLLAG